MSSSKPEPAAEATPAVAASAVPLSYQSPVTIGYGQTSARGGVITTAVSFLTAGVNFGTNLVLSWLLSPADFGLLALASSIVAIIAVFRDCGAQQILIQRQKEFDRIAGSAFWLTVGASLACALATLVAAPVAAHLKHNPEVAGVLYVLAIRFLLGGFGVVSNARLTIDLRWAALGAINLASAVIVAVTSLVLAWLKFGVYSVIIGGIAGDLFRSIASWQAAKLKSSGRPQWTVLRGILVSSGMILGTALTVAARANGDYLTLSFLTTEAETGQYFFAFVLAAGLAKLAVGGLAALLMPVLSKVQNDRPRYESILRRSTHAYAIVGILPIILQACLAWPMFRLFLSAKWTPAIVLFCALSLLNLAKFLNTVPTQAMQAAGYFRHIFIFAIVFAPFEIGMFVIGALIARAEGVAWFAAASAFVDFIAFHALSFAVLRISWKTTIFPLWRPVLAALPTILIAITLPHMLPRSRAGDALVIICVTLFGAASYLSILWLLWREVMRDLLIRGTEAVTAIVTMFRAKSGLLSGIDPQPRG